LKKVLLISFDAVSNKDVEALLQMKHFGMLKKKGTLVRDVQSVFISNTYPIHTSIITGTHPHLHGIIENLKPQTDVPDPDWYWYSSDIKVETLYQAAAKCGMVVASVMWPVTAGAREIKYNIPEIFPNRGKKQLMVSLQAGSKFLQIKEFIRHGKILKGISQPQVDQFAVNCLCDIIKEKNPDFMMLHLTDCDTHKHKFGINSKEVKASLERLDQSLGKILNVTSYMEDLTVIIVSDHAQLDVTKSVNPNSYLEKEGLLKINEDGTIYDYSCWVKCSGGSAVLITKSYTNFDTIQKAKTLLKKCEGFDRFLTDEEMKLSGHEHCPFGFSAKPGYQFTMKPNPYEKANHGYTLDNDNYTTFYMVAGHDICKNKELEGGSLLDIAPIIAKTLDIEMPRMQGELLEGIYNEDDKE
jgi:predicted AlkP superfamily pyrophosphatase or phosphodiesterase